MASSTQSNSKSTTSSSVEELSLIDRLVSEEGMFLIPPEQAAGLRLRCLHEALAWHLDPESPYGRYAERQGFSLPKLQEPGGLNAVPLLPSALFKRRGVSVAHPRAGDILWTTSSGTQGGLSQIPRDDTTLRRFFSSIAILTKSVLEVENPDADLLALGPPADEAKNLWIAYVTAGTAVLLPRTKHYVRDGALHIEDAIRDLQALEGVHVGIMGPPPLILELAKAVSARRVPLRLRHTSQVITIGGWKRRSGEAVPRADFDETVSSAFGLGVAQVRDIFNMVELNTVIMECSAKSLHIPPWLYVRARNHATLEVVPSGVSGVLSYLDPTAVSYPAFILSDDLGVVFENQTCACGRTSDVLKIERRLNTVETRGCALKMDTIGAS